MRDVSPVTLQMFFLFGFSSRRFRAKKFFLSLAATIAGYECGHEEVPNVSGNTDLTTERDGGYQLREIRCDTEILSSEFRTADMTYAQGPLLTCNATRMPFLSRTS